MKHEFWEGNGSLCPPGTGERDFKSSAQGSVFVTPTRSNGTFWRNILDFYVHGGGEIDQRKDTPWELCVEPSVLCRSRVTGGHPEPRETLGESWRRPWNPEDSSLAACRPLSSEAQDASEAPAQSALLPPTWSPTASPSLRQHLDPELPFITHPSQGCHQPTVMNSAGHHAKACACGFGAELLRCEVVPISRSQWKFLVELVLQLPLPLCRVDPVQ